MTIRARVIVASNRAARVGVPDGDPVAEALRAAIADGVDVVLTSGGTGVTRWRVSRVRW